MLLERPGGQFVVQVTGGIGEGREHDHLAVARVEWGLEFGFTHLSERIELGVTCGAHLVGG